MSYRRFLLDTNTISYVVNGRSPLVRQRLVEYRGKASIFISAIAEAEILRGLERKAVGTRVRTDLSNFFTTVHRVAWDSEAATSYAQLTTQLSKSGLSLSLMDSLIAAHALALNATLVTHDRAFSHLAPFLSVEDWATDL